MSNFKAARKLSRIDIKYANVACSCDTHFVEEWLEHIFQHLANCCTS